LRERQKKEGDERGSEKIRGTVKLLFESRFLRLAFEEEFVNAGGKVVFIMISTVIFDNKNIMKYY
jgi:hypothetical protein